MTTAERRLDLIPLTAIVVAIPLIVLGIATNRVFISVAVIVVMVTVMATEVVRARRFGHPVLDRRGLPRLRRRANGDK
jgi:hypothetical protein